MKLSNVRAKLKKKHPHPGVDTSCEICGGKKMLNLDHCHVKNRFRGYLCRECNLACGLLGDHSTAVRKAFEYLERAEKRIAEGPSESESGSEDDPDSEYLDSESER
jgi:hypothetical protein